MTQEKIDSIRERMCDNYCKFPVNALEASAGGERMSDSILATGLTASNVKWRNVIEKTAQEWIPTSERLPEENTEVLATVWVDDEVYIENVVYTHGRWDSIYEHYELEVYGRNRNSDVIAWMPLPEPYVEVKNDRHFK